MLAQEDNIRNTMHRGAVRQEGDKSSVEFDLSKLEAPIGRMKIKELAEAFHGHVKFEADVVEPQRTSKRRDWRPQTPHPVQSPEAAKRFLVGKSKEAASALAAHNPERETKTRRLIFDWTGFAPSKTQPVAS